ncbi:MAG: hypothetical protein P8Y69_15515 [Gammaproteobacteria bacterium]
MRILYLTANPQWVKRNEPLPADGDQPKNLRGLFKEYEKLDLWAELREVTDVLFDARAEGTVQLEVVPEVRRADVVRYVNARHPNVLHFSGHGEKQEIILNDKYGEDGELVSEEWLRGVLADKDIDVLVLNCCWSDTLAAALEDVVDLIIGTTVPLGGESAAEFSKTFYDALQNGVTLGQAFDAATKNVGEGLYRKTHRDPSILEKTFELQPEPAPQPAVQPAAGEEAAVTLTPAQQILNYQTRLGYMRDRLSANVLWDVGVFPGPCGLGLVEGVPGSRDLQRHGTHAHAHRDMGALAQMGAGRHHDRPHRHPGRTLRELSVDLARQQGRRPRAHGRRHPARAHHRA